MNQHNFDRVIKQVVDYRLQDGRSYKDIVSELEANLLPWQHEVKKLGRSRKTGKDSYYIYVPWKRLRDRLRQIVGGSGFRFEITSTYYLEDGTPVMIGVLNILGIEHQGVGYGRSNEYYKGGNEEIAYSDAFKNAAAFHGLGAYLDEQVEVADYLKDCGDRSLEAHAKNILAESGTTPSRQATSPPKAAVTPKAVPRTTSSNDLYPQHNTQIKKLRQKLGIKPETVLSLTSDRKPSSLSLEEYEKFLILLVSEWAADKGCFPSIALAKQNLLNSLDVGLGLYDNICKWTDSIQRVPAH